MKTVYTRVYVYFAKTGELFKTISLAFLLTREDAYLKSLEMQKDLENDQKQMLSYQKQ